MYKFIALQNDVYYSVAEEKGKRSFFANKKGTGYNTRKDVTPEGDVNDSLLKEIHKRPTIGSEMSPALQEFVNTLEKNFRALKE